MKFDFFTSTLSRREAIRLISGTAFALTLGRTAIAKVALDSAGLTPFTPSNSSASVLTPELTEGPYYIDLERIRRDITEGKPGVPLRLRIRVAHLQTGVPIPGAAVDVWHCDAAGVYSGFNTHLSPPGRHPPFPPGPPSLGFTQGGSFSPPPTGFPSRGFPPGAPSHLHKLDNALTFLRGVQITDADGFAIIDTIFPGWYEGRTTHIHVRVHSGGLVEDGRYRKGHISHTGQIFLPEAMTSQIDQLPAYTHRFGARIPLQEDGIFRQGGRNIANLVPVDPGNPSRGYLSDTLLIIDPTATPAPA